MFKSFYMAGFESSTGRNRHGQVLDQLASTEHDRRAEEDYALVAEQGISTVRDASRWSLIDRGGRYEFDALTPLVRAARGSRMQVIWDLFHYGYPEELDPFSTEFAARLASYGAAVATHLARELPGAQCFTPVNEPSYFAWAAAEVGEFGPHEHGRGDELKRSLVRAQIATIRAIRAVNPDARFVTVDPVCHVVPPHGATLEEQSRARHFSHDIVFQFLDMCSGRTAPELGGHPSFVDVIGLNYYASNQWELDRPAAPLADDDPRRLRPAELCRFAERRYGLPFMISETAASGEQRAGWIASMSAMSSELLDESSQLLGVCLYPVLGMPEWHELSRWIQMGLWDLDPAVGSLERRPHLPALHALREAQAAHALRTRSYRRCSTG